MSYQAEKRQRVVAAMQRRGLSQGEVARMARMHPRTVQRFVTAETFDLRTLDKLEAALRLNGQPADTAPDSDVGSCVKVLAPSHKGPVSGWKQAAHLLGMSRWTLWAHRRRHEDRTSMPRWRDVEALWRWYDRMTGREVP